MKNLILIVFLLSVSLCAFGQASPGAIFSGDYIKMLKKNIIFKDSDAVILTGDSDDPSSVAKTGAKGSLYIRSTNGVWYQKQDNGSSTNWTRLYFVAPLTASRAMVTDGSGLPSASTATSTQIGYLDSLTAANGGLIYSDADSLVVGSVGTSGQPLLSGGAGAYTWFSSSGVVKATSGVLSTSNVDLTSEVTGALPIANGGTNSSTALNNNRVMISSGGGVVENGALSASAPMRTNASGLPTTGSTSLTTEVSGVLPETSGGTDQITYTTGDTLYSSSSNNLSKLAIGTKGQNLKVVSGIPSWKEPDFDQGNIYEENFERNITSSGLTTGDGTLLAGSAITGTVADETTNFIDGANNIATNTGTSIKYTQASGSLNDYICGPAISLGSSTNRKVNSNYVGLSFDYTYSGSSSEIKAGIYDVTNSTFLATSLDVLTATSTVKKYATANYLPSTTQSIRWCIQTVVENSGKILYFDNVQLSTDPVKFFNLNAITAWRSYTPVSSWVSNTSLSGLWRQVGENMELQLKAATSGAPTSAGLRFDLPSGYTMDTSKFLDTSGFHTELGRGSVYDNGTQTYDVAVGYFDTDTIYLTVVGTASTYATNGTAVSNTVPITFGASDSVVIRASVPITNWTATVENLVTPANSPRQTALTTSGTGWTDVRSVGTYYRTSDGAHRLKFNIYGTVSSAARTNYSISVSGVTFKNVSGYDQAISAYGTNSPNLQQAYVSANSSTIAITHSSATTTYYIFSGDVELNSKPTWADDVHTNFLAAVPANIVTSPESTHTQPKVCSFALSTTSDVLSEITGSCFSGTSCTNNGTGDTTCTFKSGYWTTQEQCTCSAATTNFGRSCSAFDSTTSVQIIRSNGASAEDGAVNVVCHGY